MTLLSCDEKFLRSSTRSRLSFFPPFLLSMRLSSDLRRFNMGRSESTTLPIAEHLGDDATGGNLCIGWSLAKAMRESEIRSRSFSIRVRRGAKTRVDGKTAPAERKPSQSLLHSYIYPAGQFVRPPDHSHVASSHGPESLPLISSDSH